MPLFLTKTFIAARRLPGYGYDRMLEILHREIRHMDYMICSAACQLATTTDRPSLEPGQDRPVADNCYPGWGPRLRPPMVYVKREIYLYGSYHGQFGLPVPPDTMAYLTNKVIENAVVYDHYQKTYERVYAFEMFYEKDPYDIFLAGARPLLTIENRACTGGRELILFRDSGSSIAPLLLPAFPRSSWWTCATSPPPCWLNISTSRKRGMCSFFTAPRSSTPAGCSSDIFFCHLEQPRYELVAVGGRAELL